MAERGLRGEMMVKSGLVTQISCFRPQDVPVRKLILLQVGPIANQGKINQDI